MKIAPGLHALATEKGGHVHAYIVEHPAENGLILIDTMHDENALQVREYLASIGKKPQDILFILLTHSHHNHIAGLATLAELSAARVMAHNWEIGIIEGRRPAEKVGWRPPKPWNWTVAAFQAGVNFGIKKHRPQTVHRGLSDGDRVGPLHVIGVPGHTPGCLAFWLPEAKAVIAGDAVSTWPVYPEISWPSFDLDHDEAQRSVAKLGELPAEICCCGHGAPIMENAQRVLQQLGSKPI